MADLFSNVLISWELTEQQLDEAINRGMNRQSPRADRQLLVMLEDEEWRLPAEQRSRLRQAGISVALVPAKLKGADAGEVRAYLEERKKRAVDARAGLSTDVVENSTIDAYTPPVPVSDQELAEIIEQSNSVDYSTTNGV